VLVPYGVTASTGVEASRADKLLCGLVLGGTGGEDPARSSDKRWVGG